MSLGYDIPREWFQQKLARKGARRWIGRDLQEGEELWSYHSPDETWQTLCGRSGYVVIKNGCPIEDIVVGQN